MMPKLSPSQLRAARGLLNWSRADLAKLSGISEPTIHRFENGTNVPEARTASKLLSVFNKHGVEFIENQGVRFKPSNIEIFDGPDRFDDFYDFLYEHLKKHGGEVCLSVADQDLLAKFRKDPDIHYKRMKSLVDQRIIKPWRILATKSRYFNRPMFSTFRCLPGDGLSPTAFYAFGDCLALLSFVNPRSPHIVVIHSGPLTEAYRQSFDMAWRQAKNPPQVVLKYKERKES